MCASLAEAILYSRGITLWPSEVGRIGLTSVNCLVS